jgi:ribosome-associated translation inhibitor RaiA/cold shock CspA family protein
MQTPLEIAFHNFPSSPRLEVDIRARVGKLERLYERLTACRVSIEARHQQHRTGNVYEVHIVLMVPGQELVVSHELHKGKLRRAEPDDVQGSIRDAFRAAERQLKEFKRRIRGEVKAHDMLLHGEVSQLFPNGDYGFIWTSAGTQLYFHRNSVLGATFDQLTRGVPVHFVESDGDTGPIASKVWLAAEEDMA